MKDPLVSICIPAYNAEKYISASLDSILNQSYSNIEVIVVNDGSIDSTGKILKDYEAQGVRVLHQPNKGQCAAANTAFRNSSGEYIKFFDADDLLCQNFIAEQVARLEGRKDAIASARWGRFYGNDLKTFQLNPEAVWKDMPSIEWLVASLTSGHNMMQCGLWLIPRSLLSQSGLWDERLSLINDFDFFIRVILASKMVLFTQKATLYYRSGIENSLSGQKSKKAMESAFLSTKLGVEALLKYEASPRTRKIGADAFQLWKYQFYPSQPELFKKADAYVQQLGGSIFAYPSGGVTKLISHLIGWKNTKQLKLYFNRKVD